MVEGFRHLLLLVTAAPQVLTLPAAWSTIEKVEQVVSQDGTSVRALERGLRLLTEVLDFERAVGVNELARSAQLPKGTVSRLLATLVRCGYLSCNPLDGLYSPGPEAVRRLLGPALTGSFRAAVREAMTMLRDASGETVALQVPVWPDRVCVEQVESLSGLRRVHNIGERKPLTTASPGRCYLAFVSEEEVERALQARPPEPMTPFTITEPDLLRQELARVRADGYAITISESIVGMCGIAAPILGQEGRPIAMISVAGPEVRWNRSAMVKFAPTLIETTSRLSLASEGVPGGRAGR